MTSRDASSDPPEPWRARLDLVFRRMGERTVLVSDRHEGPLRVQRPFFEPDGASQVVIIHPPGGIAGGDELRLHAVLEAGAQALLTSPGAAKLYRSAGPQSRVEQSFVVASGASLEWLPQETIVFSGANASVTTRVALEPGARFIGWDIVSLGSVSGSSSIEGSRRCGSIVSASKAARRASKSRLGSAGIRRSACSLRTPRPRPL
jgi:urease accessory protein